MVVSALTRNWTRDLSAIKPTFWPLYHHFDTTPIHIVTHSHLTSPHIISIFFRSPPLYFAWTMLARKVLRRLCENFEGLIASWWQAAIIVNKPSSNFCLKSTKWSCICKIFLKREVLWNIAKCSCEQCLKLDQRSERFFLLSKHTAYQSLKGEWKRGFRGDSDDVSTVEKWT